MILGGFWDTKIAPKRAQDGAKMTPRRPKMAPRRPKMAPRRPNEGPKRLQDGPRRRQIREKKKAQKRSEAESPPDLVFGAFLGGFWEVFGWIRDGFGDEFGSLGVDF